ncbi:hypothetical protein B0H17DRAFT_1130101 [Mycena rosella]|uniref:Uncharacterized protein n=1 Tax=Mycena rosella TaxID=1033263 RepID=A0AAD7GJL9_MYCRO|nr:hypothetical protein B0H17DRAFT_1130101 [Mycena rosella]
MQPFTIACGVALPLGLLVPRALVAPFSTIALTPIGYRLNTRFLSGALYRTSGATSIFSTRPATSCRRPATSCRWHSPAARKPMPGGAVPGVAWGNADDVVDGLAATIEVDGATDAQITITPGATKDESQTTFVTIVTIVNTAYIKYMTKLVKHTFQRSSMLENPPGISEIV